MPYHVFCPQSGEQAIVDCACPDGHDALVLGEHHRTCAMGSLGAAITCPPSAGCCDQDHDHDQAANGCHGQHDGEPCPEPGTCRVHRSVKAHHAAMLSHGADAGDPPPDDCPGGHCHRDIGDCAVCHPLIITAIGGPVPAATLRPVTGG